MVSGEAPQDQGGRRGSWEAARVRAGALGWKGPTLTHYEHSCRPMSRQQTSPSWPGSPQRSPRPSSPMWVEGLRRGSGPGRKPRGRSTARNSPRRQNWPQCVTASNTSTGIWWMNNARPAMISPSSDGHPGLHEAVGQIKPSRCRPSFQGQARAPAGTPEHCL